MMQSVACNALHSVEARFCRWLLACHDRIDSNAIQLTQEFLALYDTLDARDLSAGSPQARRLFS